MVTVVVEVVVVAVEAVVVALVLMQESLECVACGSGEAIVVALVVGG